ncbi:hypothetical protein OG894_37305 [Streptomyces sp. NBC_01724]|uniref:hypothetical protein n=1 Tax=unclassified Streptomyces TaxID=2593676 RepID=UPI0028C508CB|nr:MULTISPECIES: hypothetical protein [unclassified Streptomyces]WTE49987.1 hypothetical protein OG987_04440 [Streptomyces sp. NBC_01620]WTE58072.1 hypothetical protein OG784_04545 [Streptomyces sp. NBC_01617]WTI85603.1 hypothetical protein OHB17_05010 [Streptomyces sp. NBC_00724]WNO63115.1 hypothetical protein RPQ02_04605 [Streptomyces sp. AM2-3-1]WSC67696.1 hypothetical protein OG807_04255 [Streptomyces sp. NBC_01760]
MPYKQGQRVEYRNQEGQQSQGTIQAAEGSGQQTRYTVKNEKNMQQEQVPESKIERQL